MKLSKKNYNEFITPYGNIHINKNSWYYAIKLSGGFDSAVMLYLIAKTISTYNKNAKILTMTVRRANSTNFSEFDRVNSFEYADKIIRWIKEEFPDIIIEESAKIDADFWWIGEYKDGKKISSYLQNQELLNNYFVWKYYKPAFKKKESFHLDTIFYASFTGTTKNPNTPDIPESLESHRNSKLDPIFDSSLTVSHVIHNMEISEPFRNGDKRVTFWLADQLNILDKVLEITRSCEGDRESTDNWTKDCKTCWWCLEREWAQKNYKSIG
jgi:hypothetical protein